MALPSMLVGQFFTQSLGERSFWTLEGTPNWNDASADITFGPDGCTWSNIDGSECAGTQSQNTGAADFAMITESMAINDACNVQIEIDYTAVGDFECFFGPQRNLCPLVQNVGNYGHDQLFLDYRVDGGDWIEFASFCQNQGGSGTFVSAQAIQGNILEVRVVGGIQAADEFVTLRELRLIDLTQATTLSTSIPSPLCAGSTNPDNSISLPSDVQGVAGQWFDDQNNAVVAVDPSLYNPGDDPVFRFEPNPENCVSNNGLSVQVAMIDCRCPLIRIERLSNECLSPIDANDLSTYEQLVRYRVVGQGNFDFSWEINSSDGRIQESGSGNYSSDNEIDVTLPGFDLNGAAYMPLLTVTDLSSDANCQNDQDRIKEERIPVIDESTNDDCNIPITTMINSISCNGKDMVIDLTIEKSGVSGGISIQAIDDATNVGLLVSPSQIAYNTPQTVTISAPSTSDLNIFFPDLFGVENPFQLPVQRSEILDDPLFVSPSLLLFDAASDGTVLFQTIDPSTVQCSEDGRTLTFVAAVQAVGDPNGLFYRRSADVFDGSYMLDHNLGSTVDLAPSGGVLPFFLTQNDGVSEPRRTFTMTSSSPLPEFVDLEFINSKTPSCVSTWRLETGCPVINCEPRVSDLQIAPTCDSTGSIAFSVEGLVQATSVEFALLPDTTPILTYDSSALAEDGDSVVTFSATSLQPGDYLIRLTDDSAGCSFDTILEVSAIDYELIINTQFDDCDSLTIDINSTGADLSNSTFFLINTTQGDTTEIPQDWGLRYQPGDSIAILGVDSITGCSYQESILLSAGSSVIIDDIQVSCNPDSSAILLDVTFEELRRGQVRGFRFSSEPNGIIDTLLDIGNGLNYTFEVPLTFAENSLTVLDTNNNNQGCSDQRFVPDVPRCFQPCDISVANPRWFCEIMGTDYEYRLEFDIDVSGRDTADRYLIEVDGVVTPMPYFQEFQYFGRMFAPTDFLVFVDELDASCRDTLILTGTQPNCCDSVWDFRGPIVIDETCNASNGSISFDIDTSIYGIDWDDPDFPVNADSVGDLRAGVYRVNISFPACPGEDSVFDGIIVMAQDQFNFSGTVTQPTAPDARDGRIDLECRDCDVPYTLIVNGDTTTGITALVSTLSNLGDTMIEVVYIGPQSGCRDTLSFVLSSDCPFLSVEIDSFLSDFCEGIIAIKASDTTDIGIWDVIMSDGTVIPFEPTDSTAEIQLNNGLDSVRLAAQGSTSCDTLLRFELFRPILDSLVILRKANCNNPLTQIQVFADTLLPDWIIYARDQQTGVDTPISEVAELPPGVYSIYIEYGDFCQSVSIPVSLGELDSLNVYNVIDPSAPGINDGSVNFGCIGCDLPFTILVNGTVLSLNGDTTLTSLGDTTLFIELRDDATGCSSFDTVVLESQCPPLSPRIDSSVSDICSNSTIIRFDTASDYTIWSIELNADDISGQIEGDSLDLSNLTEGQYSLITGLLSGGLCNDTILFDNRFYTLDAVRLEDTITCANPTASVTLESPDTAQADIEYFWVNLLSQDTFRSISPQFEMSPGDYQFFVQSPNGCIDASTDTITIDSANLISIGVETILEPSFSGDYMDGSVRITCNGCLMDSFILWIDGDSIGSYMTDAVLLNILDTNEHTYVIQDANGCFDTLMTALPPCPSLEIGIEATDPTCDDPRGGSIILTNLPEAPLVLLNGGRRNPPDSLLGLGPDVYTVQVESAQGIDRCFIPQSERVELRLPLLLNHSWNGSSVTITRGDSTRLPNGDGSLVGFPYSWVALDSTNAEPCGVLLGCFVSPDQTTTYELQVGVESCDSPYLFTVNVIEPASDLIYPNILSSLDRANSGFILQDLSRRVLFLEDFKVFNRHGAIVWAENNITRSGSIFRTNFDLINNGDLIDLSSDVYTFMLSARFDNGLLRYVSGTITVLND